MDFRESQPIYLQIADYACEKILLQEWKPGERIPSVRELAVQLEVNPNTVMRTYEHLQQQEIIYNQRGIGYHVAAGAVRKALLYRKNEFTEKDLPVLFRNLYLLEIDIDELKQLYTNYINQYFSVNNR
ncbi:MAG TPA: GntR family transcriptional regulator [Chitinophagaceae bacterium]|nr:GntR family transcriptional regulator [Chitinophagaceae bacterium]